MPCFEFKLGSVAAAVENNLWDNVLRSIRPKLQNESFETWFNPIRFEGIDDTRRCIRLRAPNQVVRDWVTSHYGGLVNESLNEVRLSGYQVEWHLPGETFKTAAETTEPVAAVVEPVPDTVPPAPQIQTQPPAVAAVMDPLLNSKYTFDNFVVGSCNQFAHAASVAVAEAPGKTYNPLYLYGGVGLGKTHLMHACGHAIKQRNPHLKLHYLSSERFMNELINAIRYDKTQ
ncbi:MAG TPA: DnaA/Hda family protein, partial [Pyrinomonadaceae bacterium]|nr:DnaA/Hda family protein [Pyrinomonadaceae bacterium]